LKSLQSLDLRGHRCGWYRNRRGEEEGGIAELARSPLLGQLRRLLLGQSWPSDGWSSNGWTAQVLSPIQPADRIELLQDTWIVTQLRQSRYLIPSQLVECDLEELWWLGDTRNRERRPLAPWVVDWLEEFPELIEKMEPTQARVLRMRYGLDEQPRTLQEIGECLGLPRERVREIEKEALRILSGLRRGLVGELFGR
jgi:hypothetical protein